MSQYFNSITQIIFLVFFNIQKTVKNDYTKETCSERTCSEARNVFHLHASKFLYHKTSAVVLYALTRKKIRHKYRNKHQTKALARWQNQFLTTMVR